MTAARKAAFRFHHVSTDEVFGALGHDDPPFTETTPYDPRSPYSATKAASDHLVRAWSHTYKLPTIVSNTCNNYGPWQFPEKLIPLVTLNALEGSELPVYGDGSNMRDWLFVEDHAEALVRVVESGVPGETYAIGGRQPRTNLQVVKAICAHLDQRVPDPAGPRERLIRFVTDRPGHDFRYEIDPSRSEAALDWKAPHDFEPGLAARLTGTWLTGLVGSPARRNTRPAPRPTTDWSRPEGALRHPRTLRADQRVPRGGKHPRRDEARGIIRTLDKRKTRHEGHPAGRRFGNAPASDDPGGVETIAAGLRQANGLLSAVDADAGGYQGHHADLHA